MMKPLRVLVIEDEAVTAMLFSEVLEAMGYEVCALEATEQDAVAAAHRHNPDLMIVDERLSEGSGVVAVQEILQHRFVPHVFVSGDSSALRSLPQAICVEKPFRESELKHAISQAMEIGSSANADRDPKG